jgi:DUF438 domain-containing protein
MLKITQTETESQEYRRNRSSFLSVLQIDIFRLIYTTNILILIIVEMLNSFLCEQPKIMSQPSSSQKPDGIQRRLSQ